jgi:hypothetical protein
MYHQWYDSQTNVREYSLSFELLHVYDIVDPPSMFLTTFTPEFESFYGIDFERTLMTRGETVECDVVWHERPSPEWFPLSGNTCRPGQYELSQLDRSNRQDRDRTALYYESDMPPLRWRIPGGEFELEGARIAAAFGVPPAMIGPPPGAAMPGPRLEDQLAQIMEARREYEARNNRRPRVLLMNTEDWEQLRRDALRLEEDLRRGMIFGPPAATFHSLFDLEVRAERNLPRGRIYVTGDPVADYEVRPYLPPQMSFGDPSRYPGVPYPMSMSGPGGGGAGGNATYMPQDPIAWAGSAAPSYSSAVLPEGELIDEIDRLVNESVAVGPVDDYHVDRYPKCSHCQHDWHGVLCDHCDCLGELEEEV